MGWYSLGVINDTGVVNAEERHLKDTLETPEALALLFEMQDRRKRAAVPDAEIVGAGDG